MRIIDRSRYSAPARAIIERAFAAGLPRALPFGPPVEGERAALQGLRPAALVGTRAERDADAWACLQAGLWLLHDHMDEGHGIVQDLDSVDAAYWHGIVHRREPDPGNARYWFAQVGEHPIHPELLADARTLLGDDPTLRGLTEGGRWRPAAFVEACTGAVDAGRERVLLDIQRREWELLFDHGWSRAFG